MKFRLQFERLNSRQTKLWSEINQRDRKRTEMYKSTNNSDPVGGCNG